jgi:hypothetical protein
MGTVDHVGCILITPKGQKPRAGMAVTGKAKAKATAKPKSKKKR